MAKLRPPYFLKKFTLGVRYVEKTQNLVYMHEILGICRHLEAIEAHKAVPVSQLHSEGPEALNTVVLSAVESITRGLSDLGLPNGRQDAVLNHFEIYCCRNGCCCRE